MKTASKATLLVHCADHAGIVATLSQFIYEHQGNILSLHEYGEGTGGQFFMRLVWELDRFTLSQQECQERLDAIGQQWDLRLNLHYSAVRPQIAVFVSKEAHCLYDLLHSQELGELEGDISLILSNHESLRSVAEHFKIPYHVIPVSSETRADAEGAQQALLKEHQINLMVLARYMQVLSPSFAQSWYGRCINIHHSFLPSFAGANPYKQARARGVKIIGATAHYVTEELDDGPIIEQKVTRVSHRDSVADLKRKGRDMERQVLTHAVRLHLEHKILISGNKTIVFNA